MTTPDQIREAVTPEIGCWYELEGGGIVRCVAIDEQYFTFSWYNDGTNGASVSSAMILRAVPNPHDRIAQLEAENAALRTRAEGWERVADIMANKITQSHAYDKDRWSCTYCDAIRAYREAKGGKDDL